MFVGVSRLFVGQQYLLYRPMNQRCLKRLHCMDTSVCSNLLPFETFRNCRFWSFHYWGSLAMTQSDKLGVIWVEVFTVVNLFKGYEVFVRFCLHFNRDAVDQAFECYAQVLKVGASFFRAPDGWKAMKIQQSHMFSLLLSKETFLPC